MNDKKRLLIVDDDESTRRTLRLIFGKKGYEAEAAATGREAMEKARGRFFNLALLDIRLPDMEGVELIAPLKEMHPDLVVIMVTAYASLETAVQALNEGASAYITKPLNMDEVLVTVREALEKQRLVMENRRLHQGARRELAERKLLEKQLVQAQKLESLGQLAAGIAHEINTPAQYVGDNTRFLQDAFGDLNRLLDRHDRLLKAVKAGDSPADLVREIEETVEEVDLPYLTAEIPKAVQQTLEGVERISKIVLAMKAFSHPGPKEKTPVDINEAIENTITVARNEWKYVAEMVTELDATLPPVPCLPGEFNQVILNMIVNAAHAIGDVMSDGSNGKGTIKVSTSRDGPWAEIRIRDTGTGIPEEIQSRIFDPFFTTKEVGRGSGQGLALAHSTIVQKHGGTIDFETASGKGTTFIIRIPIEDRGP